MWSGPSGVAPQYREVVKEPRWGRQGCDVAAREPRAGTGTRRTHLRVRLAALAAALAFAAVPFGVLPNVYAVPLIGVALAATPTSIIRRRNTLTVPDFPRPGLPDTTVRTDPGSSMVGTNPHRDQLAFPILCTVDSCRHPDGVAPSYRYSRAGGNRIAEGGSASAASRNGSQNCPVALFSSRNDNFGASGGGRRISPPLGSSLIANVEHRAARVPSGSSFRRTGPGNEP
jgi:hypothetical protein